MVKKNFLLGLSLILVSLFVFSPYGVKAHQDEPHGSSNKAIIHMVEDGFEPENVEVEAGATVVFENLDDKLRWPASNIHPTHRLYPGSGIEKCGTDEEGQIFDACRGVEPGESYSFIFNKPGTWRFHDHLIPQFKGSITVAGEEIGIQPGNESEVNKELGFARKVLNHIVKLINKVSYSLFNKNLITQDRQEDIQVEGYIYSDVPEDTQEMFENDDVLYSYIKKYGPAKTTKRLAGMGRSFGNCHNRAHEAGRLAYQIYGAEAFQTCSAQCHSGCYHGATEAFFREKGTQNLEENISTICSSDLNSFFSHQCIHGIGHGLMAFYDYEIHDALSACDLLPERQTSCYSGVFMENVVGGLAEGHSTRYLNDNPHYPCTVVNDKYKSACYFYQTSRMTKLFSGDFAKVAQACSEIKEDYQSACYGSMGRDVGGANRSDPEGAIEDCSEIPQGIQRNWCLTGAVQDYFWDSSGQDQALNFCRLLANPSEKKTCYNTIFARAAQVLETKEQMVEFCSKSENNFKNGCLEYVRKY